MCNGHIVPSDKCDVFYEPCILPTVICLQSFYLTSTHLMLQHKPIRLHSHQTIGTTCYTLKHLHLTVISPQSAALLAIYIYIYTSVCQNCIDFILLVQRIDTHSFIYTTGERFWWWFCKVSRWNSFILWSLCTFCKDAVVACCFAKML